MNIYLVHIGEISSQSCSEVKVIQHIYLISSSPIYSTLCQFLMLHPLNLSAYVFCFDAVMVHEHGRDFGAFCSNYLNRTDAYRFFHFALAWNFFFTVAKLWEKVLEGVRPLNADFIRRLLPHLLNWRRTWGVHTKSQNKLRKQTKYNPCCFGEIFLCLCVVELYKCTAKKKKTDLWMISYIYSRYQR